MTNKEFSYLIFGIALIAALVFDLGLLSKKSRVISIRAALWQTGLWVGLSLAFFIFLWLEDGQDIAVKYLSAYLMEWSLSIDNIFVFILIFTAFNIKEQQYARVLLIGILIAIVLRVLFIFIGVALVQRFSWILYVFGVFLVYTGIKMFVSRKEKAYDPEQSTAYKLIKRVLPLTDEDPMGRFVIRRNHKLLFTRLSVVIGILAGTDVIFAMDSIPAVLAISQDKLVVYTSNIFAVLGLRSLFFLLKGAVDKFTYLQQGVAIILVFIGLKMLVEILHVEIPVYASLIAIIVCIAGSIAYSLYRKKPVQS